MADVLSAAWASGIRWLDTCSSYGAGRAFRQITGWHEANAGRRFDLVLKVGRPVLDGRPRSRCSLPEILHQAEQEQVELGPASAILVKDPPEDILEAGELVPLLRALSQRFPGVRVGFSSHRLRSCQDLPPSAGYIAQIEFNAINRWVAGPTAASLRAAGWVVWGMQPLAYGFLGRLGPREFGGDDWRRRLPSSAQERLRQSAQAFHDRVHARFPRASVAQMSLAYCLQDSNLDRVVIGPRSVEQFRDLDDALRLSKDAEFSATVRG